MGHSANIHTGRHPSLLLVWSHDTLSLKCIEHSVPLIHLFHMRWFTVSTLYLQAWLLALPFWNQRERREPSCVCGTNSWSLSILLLLAALCCKPASPHRNHNDRDSSQRPEVGVKSIAAQCVTAVAMARRSKPSTITLHHHPHPSAPSCRAKFNLISPRSTLHQHFHHTSIRWSGLLFRARMQRVRRLPEALTLVTASVLNRDNNLFLSLSL